MKTKLCHRCNKDIPISEFYTNKAQSDGFGTACKKCQVARNREYRRRHAERVYAKETAAKLAIKVEVFSHYSEDITCQKCGFSDIRALTLDHINGDGADQRRETTARGTQYYRWVRDNGYPEDLQVLCMNCQWIKRHENNEHNAHKPNKKCIDNQR